MRVLDDGNICFSRTLYKEGGILRFYRGIGPALFQGPLSRFGDTAANAGVLAYLAPHDLPVAVKTGAASTTAGLWRIMIMPIDTLKTTMQVRKIIKDTEVLCPRSVCTFKRSLTGTIRWL